MGGVTLQYMTHVRFFTNVKSVDDRDPHFRNLTPDFLKFFQSEQFDLNLTEV